MDKHKDKLVYGDYIFLIGGLINGCYCTPSKKIYRVVEPFNRKDLEDEYDGLVPEWHNLEELLFLYSEEREHYYCVNSNCDYVICEKDYIRVHNTTSGCMGAEDVYGVILPFDREELDKELKDVELCGLVEKGMKSVFVKTKKSIVWGVNSDADFEIIDLNVGDKCKIVDNTSLHLFDIGTIVKVTDIEDGYITMCTDGKESWYVNPLDLEPYRDNVSKMIKEVSKNYEDSAKLFVSDYLEKEILNNSIEGKLELVSEEEKIFTGGSIHKVIITQDENKKWHYGLIYPNAKENVKDFLQYIKVLKSSLKYFSKTLDEVSKEYEDMISKSPRIGSSINDRKVRVVNVDKERFLDKGYICPDAYINATGTARGTYEDGDICIYFDNKLIEMIDEENNGVYFFVNEIEFID